MLFTTSHKFFNIKLNLTISKLSLISLDFLKCKTTDMLKNLTSIIHMMKKVVFMILKEIIFKQIIKYIQMKKELNKY